MAAQSLADLKVIDLSHVIAGPAASYYLAALGADVLKVENPAVPDAMRAVDDGGTFAALNCGKRSLAIDLKVPRLRDLLLDLVREADVFIENFRPGTAERLGVGYEDVKAVNPRIVYLSVSGYGRSGPWSSFGAYDQVVQALTGMMMVNGDEGGPPAKVGFPVVDIATGMLGALAVLAALHERAATGVGRHVDTSLAQASLQLMRPMISRVLASGQDVPRLGNRGFSGSPGAATFRCADGWLAVAANTQTQFSALCASLGVDPAETGDGAGEALAARLQQAAEGESAAALERRLNDGGVPAARVRSLAEFLREAGDGSHVDLPLGRAQDGATERRQLGSGLSGIGEPAPGGRVPALGADTREILRRAGFAGEEIAGLARSGAIHVDRNDQGRKS